MTTDIATLFQLAQQTPLPKETDHELAKRLTKEIYDTYCPKIVKKEVGSRRMGRRLSKILEKMISKYRENLVKAKECTIDVEYDEGIEDIEIMRVYFNEKTYPFEKLVDQMSDDQMGVPKEMEFELWVPVAENSAVRKRKYNVLTLFYTDLRDYIFSMHHCMKLRDICSILGYEDRGCCNDDWERCNNIHKDCLAFCATNCS